MYTHDSSSYPLTPFDDLRCSLQQFVNVSAQREPAAMLVPGEKYATDQDMGSCQKCHLRHSFIHV